MPSVARGGVAAAALVVVLATGAHWRSTHPADRGAPDVPPLAPAAGRVAGTAVRANLLGDDGYATLIARAFGAVTPENELKWSVVEPRRGHFAFGPADRIVAFAGAHHLRVRGHTLVWHHQNPGWLTKGGFGRAELAAILRDHIATTMGRYRGRIAEWDVVNEAVSDRGGLRRSFWLTRLGPGYIAQAFRWAHAADPQARLFLNDYGAEGPGPKRDGLLALARALVRAKAPIDGVGLQAHVTARAIPELRDTIARFARLGLDVEITEAEVRLRVDGHGRPLHADSALRAQAAQYARLGSACRQEPACRMFVVWGLDDRDSFAPYAYPGFGASLLFDDELRPKPAYAALRDALR